MKITILLEDTMNPESGLECEHGFSAFVEFKGKRILFDTGQSGAFINNAKKLDIDLAKTDFVVLSHGHYDHTGGLPEFLENYDCKDMTLIAHPGIFGKKLQSDKTDIGCVIGRQELETAFKECFFTKTPVELMPGASFLGEVPRTYEDPGTCADCVLNGEIVPDLVKDDSAIVFKTDKGGVLLTGCSHSGIINLAKESEKRVGKLCVIIGGFHLMYAGKQRMNNIISEFREMNVKELRPGHCTSEEAIGRMEKDLDAKRITTGEVITI